MQTGHRIAMGSEHTTKHNKDSRKRLERAHQPEGQTLETDVSQTAMSLSPANIMRLQRTIGNKAVKRLVNQSTIRRAAKPGEEDAPASAATEKPSVNLEVVDVADQVEQAVQQDAAATQVLKEETAPQETNPAEQNQQEETEDSPIQRSPASRSSLQRDDVPPPTPDKPVKRLDIAFVMGKDKQGSSNKFYNAAMMFFAVNLPNVKLVNHDAIRSMEAIFQSLRILNQPVGNLYIITHAAQDGTLAFPMHTGDKDKNISYPELQNALTNSPDMFKLPTGIIDKESQIQIKGCNIGRSQKMLDALDLAFGDGAGTVSAPKHKQNYQYRLKVKNGKVVEITATESFSPYYVEYPGDVKLSPLKQKLAFQVKYNQLNFNAKQWNKLFASGIKRTVDAQSAKLWDYDAPPEGKAQILATGRKIFKQTADLKNFRPNKVIATEEVADDSIPHPVYGGENSVAGVKHVYTVEDRHQHQEKFWIAEPTDTEQMEFNLKESMGRPEGYIFKSRRYKNAGKLIFKVAYKRTEYTIGQTIRDKEKDLFLPPQSDRDFYGGSEMQPN